MDFKQRKYGYPSTEVRLGPDGHTLYFSSSYVVPVHMPKDAGSASQSLEDMKSWNNGNLNIWTVDLGPYEDP